MSEARKLPKKTDKYGITMIKIPAGSFMMGDNSCKQVRAMCADPFDKSNKIPCADGSKEEKCTGQSHERPAHKVTLSSFWMAQTEVTQKQYYKVMGSNPSEYTSDKLGYRSENNPVEKVTWSEAKRFCEKIGYRLPTEAEFEYAQRAGTTGDHYGSLNRIAWYYKNSNNQTHPVAKKSPNSFGLYDMTGNVFEWVNDWYGKDYYKVSPGNNPKGPSSGSYSRVLRGGSFFSSSRLDYSRESPQGHDLRASGRYSNDPGSRNYCFGFRCAQ
ncbi:MAG: formylglycine-generating enzyme family protein [Deltaproteobacteria bacterium]|nr:formylglycine-generating enzyme family protein [Deltaproteobacteria bacterium]MBT6432518.1 formylglycine-generating enzyme family protein [Deltaproteobacteria bacterium]MBT6492065.1 formylglycine-generating enzyme family protein [Deltaproteobacteria bacterium]